MHTYIHVYIYIRMYMNVCTGVPSNASVHSLHMVTLRNITESQARFLQSVLALLWRTYLQAYRDAAPSARTCNQIDPYWAAASETVSILPQTISIDYPKPSFSKVVLYMQAYIEGTYGRTHIQRGTYMHALHLHCMVLQCICIASYSIALQYITLH